MAGNTTYASDFPIPGDAYDPACGTDGECDPTRPVRLHYSDGYVIRLNDTVSWQQRQASRMSPCTLGVNKPEWRGSRCSFLQTLFAA